MGVDLEVPQKLRDVPSFVRTATSTRSLPGSLWVVANMQGELDDLVKAVSQCVLKSKSELNSPHILCLIQTGFGINMGIKPELLLCWYLGFWAASCISFVSSHHRTGGVALF